jgi:hypothetical protein
MPFQIGNTLGRLTRGRKRSPEHRAALAAGHKEWRESHPEKLVRKLSSEDRVALAIGHQRWREAYQEKLSHPGSSNGRYRHGHDVAGVKSRELSSYKNAKDRCNNPNNDRYADWGGRGIKFLFTSFEQFFAELGPKPPRYVLDRINNNGHYQPGNVRWVTTHESGLNRRRPGGSGIRDSRTGRF